MNIDEPLQQFIGQSYWRPRMPSNVTNQNVSLDTPNLSSMSFPTTRSFHGSSALMYHEYERLKTFGHWPLTFIQPAAMCKAGFYYTGRYDIVRCAFCNVEVMSWEEGDDPLEDHRKWNPSCRFINNQAESGNVPMTSDQSLINLNMSDPPSPSDSGYDTCGTHEINGVDMIKRNLFVTENKNSPSVYKAKTPSNPMYASYEERLKSFSSWPVSLKIKPKVLCDAGFYYTGKGDQTICFYCGGGLKDWEDSDDPWMEHAKWFSKCTFVLLSRGEDFVKQARDSVSIHNGQFESKASSCVQDVKSPIDSSATMETDETKTGADTSCSNTPNAVSDSMLCKLCFTNSLQVVFLPCGHLMSCMECAFKLKTCGVCRKPIEQYVRTFVS